MANIRSKGNGFGPRSCDDRLLELNQTNCFSQYFKCFEEAINFYLTAEELIAFLRILPEFYKEIDVLKPSSLVDEKGNRYLHKEFFV